MFLFKCIVLFIYLNTQSNVSNAQNIGGNKSSQLNIILGKDANLQ